MNSEQFKNNMLVVMALLNRYQNSHLIGNDVQYDDIVYAGIGDVEEIRDGSLYICGAGTR